ncbi:MAG: hypothetical protein KGM96_08595 [Acidobacteriota bacterium]|nr:hypothetical protein [Acidobacteriota bacterium]
MELSAYRVAYETANSEFSEILKEFEKLGLRKNQLENVVDALRPLAGLDGQRAAIEQRAESAAFEQVQHAAELPPEPAQQVAALSLDLMPHEELSAPAAVQPAAAPSLDLMQQDEYLAPEAVEQDEEVSFEVSSDPIQRRIDSALKHRSAFRGMREYSHGVGASL